MPNFIKIGVTVSEIWQYNGLLKWRPAPSCIYWTRRWTTHEEYSVVELLCAEQRGKMYARCLIVILLLLTLAQILPTAVEACPKGNSKPKPNSKFKNYPSMAACEKGSYWRVPCCKWCDFVGKREKCTCQKGKNPGIQCECLYN